MIAKMTKHILILIHRIIRIFPVLLFIGLVFIGCQHKNNMLIPESCIDESLISDDSICYEIYAPVCGCNSETYPNDCYAEVAGIIEWTEGECD